MDILIIEDDMFKYSKIEELVKNTLKKVEITKFDNVHDTIIFLKTMTPEKVILDMSLPSHKANVGEGSPLPMPSGGIEIILELRSKSLVNLPIIILTQYPEIEIEGEFFPIKESEEEIRNVYGMTNLTVIHYQSESHSWEPKTRSFLKDNN